jgi:hypothetical protein
MLDLIEELKDLRNGIKTLLGYNSTKNNSWAVTIAKELTTVEFINKYLSKIDKTLLDYMDDPIDTFNYFKTIMRETTELGYKIDILEVLGPYNYKRTTEREKDKPVFIGYVKYNII